MTTKDYSETADSKTIISDNVRHLSSKTKKAINSSEDFWTGWIENKPKGKQWVRMAGQKPIYMNGNHYLWQRIQIECFDKNIKAKDLLEKLLKQSGLKKFKDEDGGSYGIFHRQKEYFGCWEDEAYCYVNPDFPEGYWDNHALESEFIDFC